MPITSALSGVISGAASIPLNHASIIALCVIAPKAARGPEEAQPSESEQQSQQLEGPVDSEKSPMSELEHSQQQSQQLEELVDSEESPLSESEQSQQQQCAWPCCNAPIAWIVGLAGASPGCSLIG